MPVDVSVLKQARRPLEERVADFLRGHTGKAFSIWEIGAGASVPPVDEQVFVSRWVANNEGDGSSDALIEILGALATLESNGCVEQALYSGANHYWWKAQ